MNSESIQFNVGNIYLTRTISGIFAEDEGQEIIQELLTRHASGDWGDLDEVDKSSNDMAARTGGQILSAYETTAGGAPQRVCIVTDAGHQTTTVLLPREY
jgi:hypothetical protein